MHHDFLVIIVNFETKIGGAGGLEFRKLDILVREGNDLYYCVEPKLSTTLKFSLICVRQCVLSCILKTMFFQSQLGNHSFGGTTVMLLSIIISGFNIESFHSDVCDIAKDIK